MQSYEKTVDELLNSRQPFILYDENCPLCMNLAGLASRRSRQKIAFLPWGKFRIHQGKQSSQQLQLGYWDGERLFEGKEAWRYLLSKHPDFSSLNWAAEKLNLTDQVSKFMQKTGWTLRKLCGRCPRRYRS